MTEPYVANAEFLDALFGSFEQRLDPLDRAHLVDKRRQHGGLIAAARTDLEYVSQLRSLQQGFSHPRHDVGLRDGLAEADRQRRVLVRATSQCLVDEYVPRHVLDTVENRKVRDALLAQSLHEPIPGARRSHANSGEARVSH